MTQGAAEKAERERVNEFRLAEELARVVVDAALSEASGVEEIFKASRRLRRRKARSAADTGPGG